MRATIMIGHRRIHFKTDSIPIQIYHPYTPAHAQARIDSNYLALPFSFSSVGSIPSRLSKPTKKVRPLDQSHCHLFLPKTFQAPLLLRLQTRPMYPCNS